MKRLVERILGSTRQALWFPSVKQKEAYGRLAHTLCAACIVGAVSVSFTDNGLMPYYTAMKLSALMFWSILLFWTGAILSKGD